MMAFILRCEPDFLFLLAGRPAALPLLRRFLPLFTTCLSTSEELELSSRASDLFRLLLLRGMLTLSPRRLSLEESEHSPSVVLQLFSQSLDR